MKILYIFAPQAGVHGNGFYRFAALHRAQKARQELIAAGKTPTEVWTHQYPADRPLDCAWRRDGYTVKQVVRRLNRVLEREGLMDDGGFSLSGAFTWVLSERPGYVDATKALWTDYRPHHLPVYAVTGGSEGHYIHVDGLAAYWEGKKKPDSRYKPWPKETMFLAKTFQGMKHALTIVARTTELLAA